MMHSQAIKLSSKEMILKAAEEKHPFTFKGRNIKITPILYNGIHRSQKNKGQNISSFESK